MLTCLHRVKEVQEQKEVDGEPCTEAGACIEHHKGVKISALRRLFWSMLFVPPFEWRALEDDTTSQRTYLAFCIVNEIPMPQDS
jgi:hypothetical protein